MKKSLSIFIACALIVLPRIHAVEKDSDVDISVYEDMGDTGGDALSTGISLSMLGWGFLLITGITILAIVLHQSTGDTSHS